jgi:hypothetical protein
MQVNIRFPGIYLIDSMIRFYTWAKSVESPPLLPQRNPDVELGHTNKTASGNKDRQLGHEKDDMK